MLLLLTFCLPQAVFAEEDSLLKGIFNALVSEGSSYSAEKAQMEGYGGSLYTESFEGDHFTITISGGPNGGGTYTVVRDGDYAAVRAGTYDYYGTGLALHLFRAAGAFYGLNPALVNGYITALNMRGLQSTYYRQVPAPGDQFEFRVYIAGPADLRDAEQMVLEEQDVMMYVYEPLNEYAVSMDLAFGKVILSFFGSKDSCTLLVGEYGGLDSLALQDAVLLVSGLRPDGWEAFAAGCAELLDAETPDYTVTLDPEEEAARGILEDLPEGYSFALIRFGSGE